MCVILVVQQMGKITWVAIGIYIFMLVWQFIFVGSAQPVRMKVLEKTDARVKLMNEVLTGIRVIKYYCWEKPFKGKVHDLRKVELKNTEKMAWIMSVGIDCMMSHPQHRAAGLLLAVPVRDGQATHLLRRLHLPLSLHHPANALRYDAFRYDAARRV